MFWKQGYEGTSLNDLIAAMGISKPNAAFGNKQELFRLVLARHSEGPGSYLARALEEPTARGVAEVLLRGAVRATTMPEDFGGCLTDTERSLPALSPSPHWTYSCRGDRTR
nr:TetR/AcrR family transcriptional regulator [Arthrobacter sp. ATA002]